VTRRLHFWHFCIIICGDRVTFFDNRLIGELLKPYLELVLVGMGWSFIV
jgi:hypothetical protein